MVKLNNQQWGGPINSGLTELGTADDIYFRFYLIVFNTSGQGCSYNNMHGLLETYSPGGNFYFGINSINEGANTWRGYCASYATQKDGMAQYYNTQTNDLTCGVWYRVEIHVHWYDHDENQAQTRYYIRIYDMGDNLIRDTDDMTEQGDPGTSMQDEYDLGDYWNLYGTQTTIKTGNNGPASGSGQCDIYKIAAFAIADDDWLGPIDLGSILKLKGGSGGGTFR